MGSVRARTGSIVAWATVVFACINLATGPAFAASAPVIGVALTDSAEAKPIPQDFLGLAFEYSGLPDWVTPNGPVNPVLVRLIRNLDPVGRPSIRIGGISTDRSWWPGGGVSQPRGVTFTLTPAWATEARSLAQALDAKLVLGINLEASNLTLDRVEADEFVSHIGLRWIGGMDIGNEPTLYSGVPWYHLLDGRVLPWYDDQGQAVLSRGTSWSPATYADQFAQVMRVLPTTVPVAGPDSGNPAWFAGWDRLLSPRSRIKVVTAHGYGLNNCVHMPSRPAYPSVPHLLTTYAAQSYVNQLQSNISLAHKDGDTFRIDEMGSITCNGKPGVANTMASALWMTSALFSSEAAGVDGVNLHTFPQLTNAVFDFSRAGGEWIGEVHPMYYGALLFADASPFGSHLVHSQQSGSGSVHTWTTVGPGSEVHVVAVNDSLTTEQSARVRVVPGSHPGTASLTRLSAPNAYATGDISLGGRSFGSATSTGQLRAPVNETVTSHGGTFAIKLPAASATMLSFDVQDTSPTQTQAGTRNCDADPGNSGEIAARCKRLVGWFAPQCGRYYDEGSERTVLAAAETPAKFRDIWNSEMALTATCDGFHRPTDITS